MKDLKIGDVVVTKAEITGDEEYDKALAKMNGLGKIVKIYNVNDKKTYLVKVGEKNEDSRYYQESELDVIFNDLTEQDKDDMKKSLYKIEEKLEETEKSERTQKFLGTGIELEESEMEREAAMNNVDVKVINYKKDDIEDKVEEKIIENKVQEDFSNVYVKKIYEIDERLVRDKGYVLIKDRDKENKVYIALVQDVSKSSIKLAYVKDEDKEIEQIELSAKEFAEIVA